MQNAASHCSVGWLPGSELLTVATTEREGQAGGSVMRQFTASCHSPCMLWSLSVLVSTLAFSGPPVSPSHPLPSSSRSRGRTCTILRCAVLNQAERRKQRDETHDLCALLLSVLVAAGEGAGCFSAVSDAPAKPFLATRLLRPLLDRGWSAPIPPVPAPPPIR